MYLLFLTTGIFCHIIHDLMIFMKILSLMTQKDAAERLGMMIKVLSSEMPKWLKDLVFSGL